MTTTQDNGTALAVRDFTDSQIQQRIKANISARFGLQDATPPQLNIIFLLAKRWGLDPVNEITLYEGRPFITLDGRLQLMRRNPNYRGYRTRPLTRTEREDWGYEPDDIVVECTVLTHAHGEIVERGRAGHAEVESARARAKESGKRSAPIGNWGPEIAEARAIKRAVRAAFGQDVPDEEDAQYVIEERADPERRKALAAEQQRVFSTEEDLQDPMGAAARKALVREAEASVRLDGETRVYEPDAVNDDIPAEPAHPEPEPDTREARLGTLREMARRRGIKGKPPAPQAGEDALDAAISFWDWRIAEHDRDQQAAKESQEGF